MESTTTDANGDYAFDSLFPGTFIVEEVLQSGWNQTQPVNPDYYTFATQSGLNETGLNFGNFSYGTFTGTVYNDKNGDGTQEPNDPGLSGWTIDLLNSSGTLVATTTSNSSVNTRSPISVRVSTRLRKSCRRVGRSRSRRILRARTPSRRERRDGIGAEFR